MSAQAKLSRRRVVTTLVDMLEACTPVKKVAQSLAAYLVTTKQTRAVELYLRDLELTTAQRFGVATAYVYSANQLSPKVKDQIKRLVKTSSDVKSVDLVEQTDPSLIGGLVIRTADAELDGSVRTKLRNLRSI